jgi:signal transduction histidine kinase
MNRHEPLSAFAVDSFEGAFSCAMRKCLAGEGEVALQDAYEVGRTCLANGMNVLDVAALPFRALRYVLPSSACVTEMNQVLEAAAQLLTESLSPYEMAHRGFRESVAGLRQLNDALEQEARRIAHTLHDEAGQLLVAMHLGLADLERDIPGNDPARLAPIRNLLTQLDETIRGLTQDLRPAMLDDLGLVPALEMLTGNVSKRTTLRVEVHSTLEDRLPRPMEIVLYRSVQEALTNAVKHARASRVVVSLQRTGPELCCSIKDDGAGFACSEAGAAHGTRGLGLLGMRERLSKVGGTLKISSSPGQGTILQITIPLEAQHATPGHLGRRS